MKNKLLLALILISTTAGCAFCASEPKVISDENSKKKVIEAFADLNRHTDQFFTPVITPEMRKNAEKNKTKKSNLYYDRNELNAPINPGRGSVLPVKKLRIMWQDRHKPQNTKIVQQVESSNQAILDCDVMEYFADRTELEANGDVVMTFPKNDSVIKADKLVYNQTSNLIKAFGNVVLIHNGQELFGDYMQVDMNEENAIMDKPATDVFQIRSRAKKGYMYGDKIIQENGDLLVTKKTMIKVRSEMFGPDLDTMYVNPYDKSAFKKDSHGKAFRIKTDELILNAKSEHDTVTLKHAEVYYNEKKIGTLPSITIHANKAQDYVEANYPELGTTTNLGFFAGPGFVFDTPKGTNLKVVPMFNYDAGKMGAGAIVKFKSATNKLDMAYGTANNIFIARGKQRLDDNLFFQYGANSWFDDWFLGFRMPGAIGELVYENTIPFEDFLGKDRGMSFTHRVAAGYMQDSDGEGRIVRDANQGSNVGTTRFKYMAEVAQTLYDFNKSEDLFHSNTSRDDVLWARLEMVGQGSTAVYGTGDTQMIARVGPRVHTQYKYWMQDVGYFLSGYSDKTPLVDYDRYMYGRSNVYLRESLRVHKYLTLSWFSSLNLSGDSPNNKMMQENSFFFAIGPDDIKLNIGYDTIRQQSFVTMALALDAKGSSVEYKKMVIKNPDRIGKDKNGKSINNNQSFSPASSPLSEDEGVEIPRAEVIEIEEAI